jgi:hypothetical protein
MAKKQQPSPQFIITEKEPAEPDTIGFIFDYYKNRGYDSLPPNVTVETEPFKKNLRNNLNKF